MNKVVKKRAIYEAIVNEKLSQAQVMKKFSVDKREAFNLVINAKQALAHQISNNTLEEQAVERVLAWQAQGEPKDHLGRIPVELLGDYRIAQKHLRK